MTNLYYKILGSKIRSWLPFDFDCWLFELLCKGSSNKQSKHLAKFTYSRFKDFVNIEILCYKYVKL